MRDEFRWLKGATLMASAALAAGCHADAPTSSRSAAEQETNRDASPSDPFPAAQDDAGLTPTTDEASSETSSSDQPESDGGRTGQYLGDASIDSILPPHSHDASASVAIPFTSVDYFLDWEWGSATPSDEALLLETDLGYVVAVQDALLVSYTASLLPCKTAALDEPSSPRAPWWQRAWGLISPVGVAYAGHDSESDPSMLVAPVVEDLSMASSRHWGTVFFEAAYYCRVHWVAAGATQYTEGLPPDDLLLGQTAWFRGTFQLDEAVGEFEILSDVPTGQILTFASAPREARDGSAEVTFVRRLDTLLDGIDFETDSESRMAFQLAENLAAGTTMRWESP